MRIGVSLPVRELQDDLGAIKAFAQLAEELGLTHLRVPEQIMRAGNGHLHESMMILAYIAAVTESIELVPSVIILPARQTVLFAKQAAELDLLTGGRVRLGIGVGGSREEYAFQGEDFSTRGRRCDEQIELLKQLWTQEAVSFEGRFDTVTGAGINPLPIQRPIPMWVGSGATPPPSIVRRIGRQCDGWFVMCGPDEYPSVRDGILAEAAAAGRGADEIGTEAGVAVVGAREAEWRDRVAGWRAAGLTHLCLRTLGGGLDAEGHLAKLREVVRQIPGS
ncbi:MAG: LLM class F420-dependent oxidoreductase [Gammaproteobacteria bacterium]|nr:LLM class F420-dependent oxidoreductase [Gammaproteobacteria bacterium]|tara:strand:+ start:1785 stop:2618 length:834 start_codon:yes stop_codon:yes gene_type:complete